MSNDLISEDPNAPHVPRLTRRLTGFLPQEIKAIETTIPAQSREIWNKHKVQKFNTADEFQERFISHVEWTLARSLYNCDDLAAYQATSQSVRDNLVIDWNKTQQRQTARDPKRVYYLSLEFLMGRALDNALINMRTDTDVRDVGDTDETLTKGNTSREMIKNAMNELGFKLEDILDEEPDAALGNGGLGRLAACFVDSMATGNYPAWATASATSTVFLRRRSSTGTKSRPPTTG